MSQELTTRVDALEQAVKRQFRYTAVMIILLMAALAAMGILSMKFSAYVKDHSSAAAR
jgi:hypothetical protein